MGGEEYVGQEGPLCMYDADAAWHQYMPVQVYCTPLPLLPPARYSRLRPVPPPLFRRRWPR
jgi:hypothetical protein